VEDADFAAFFDLDAFDRFAEAIVEQHSLHLGCQFAGSQAGTQRHQVPGIENQARADQLNAFANRQRGAAMTRDR
jgi:hypothetical protein